MVSSRSRKWIVRQSGGLHMSCSPALILWLGERVFIPNRANLVPSRPIHLRELSPHGRILIADIRKGVLKGPGPSNHWHCPSSGWFELNIKQSRDLCPFGSYIGCTTGRGGFKGKRGWNIEFGTIGDWFFFPEFWRNYLSVVLANENTPPPRRMKFIFTYQWLCILSVISNLYALYDHNTVAVVKSAHA